MTIDRDRLRKLAEDATPGPWETREMYSPQGRTTLRTITRKEDPVWALCVGQGRDDLTAENAAFIAAAREAVPELLDALDAAEAERDQLLNGWNEAVTTWCDEYAYLTDYEQHAGARLRAVQGVLERHGPEHAPENEADAHEDCGFRIVADLHRALDGTND